MRGTIITAQANYQITDANQTLRNGQEFVTRDLLVAGDGVRDNANIWLPTAFVTKYLTARSIDPNNSGFISTGAIISDNDLPAGVNVPNSETPTTIKERTDRITILATDPNFAPLDIQVGSFDYVTGSVTISSGVADYQVGEIYCLMGNGAATFAVITSINAGNNTLYFAQGDVFGLNQNSETGGFASVSLKNTTSITLKRVRMIQYFVDADARLIRRVFGAVGKSIADSVIAEHLQTLQFDYVLKSKNSADTTIYDSVMHQVDFPQNSLIRLVGFSIFCETVKPLQDGEKYVVEGTARIGVRNMQFKEAPVPIDAEGNLTLSN